MPTDTFYPACDGILRRYTGSETWQQAHDATTGTDVYDTNAETSLVYSDSSLGLVIRGFFTFDTSALPKNANLSSVKLRLYGSGATGSSGSVDVVSNTQASNTALSTADYDKAGTTAWASLNLSSWSTSAYNDLTLDSNGIAAVSFTGYSKFAVRHSSDRGNSSPGGTFAARCYYSEQTGTSNDPRLEVTYTLPTLAATASLPAPVVGEASNASVNAVPLIATASLSAPSVATAALDCFSTAGGDGSIYHANVSWATLRSASTGTTAYPSNARENGCLSDNGVSAIAQYAIDRGFLTFDTSALPDDAVVQAAYLNVYVYVVTATGGGNVCVVASSQSSSTALTTADFGSVGSTEFVSRTTGLNGGATTFANLTNNAYNTFQLNSSGNAAISKTGYTKLALRTSADVDNSAPSSGNRSQMAISYADQTGTSEDPYLTILYTVPSATVTSPALAASAALPAPNVTATSPNVTVFSPALAAGAVLASPSVSASDGRFKVTATGGSRTAYAARTTLVTAGTVGTFGAHNAFPSGVQMANGVSRIFYRKATSHGSFDGALVTRTSADSFATATTVVSSAHDERDPCIRKLASGRLVVVWQQRQSHSPSSRFYARFMYSDDNGATWSTPATITTGHDPNVAIGSDILELSNGNLLAFTYGRATEASGTWDIRVSRSTDSGATWADYGSVITGSTLGANAVEPQAQLIGSTIYVSLHAESIPQKAWYVTSTDSGATWSSASAIQSGGTQFNASNRGGLLYTADGDMVFVATPSGVGIELRQSFNNGTSWSSAYDPEGGTPATYIAPVWITPFRIGSEGTSPNVALVWAEESSGQDAAQVYYRELTRSSTVAGPQAGMNLVATAGLPSPGVSTSTGAASVTVTAAPLTAAVALPAPAVSSGVDAQVTATPLTASVSSPAPIVVTTTFTNLIVNAPRLAASIALPTPPSGTEDYRLFFDLSPFL